MSIVYKLLIITLATISPYAYAIDEGSSGLSIGLVQLAYSVEIFDIHTKNTGDIKKQMEQYGAVIEKAESLDEVKTNARLLLGDLAEIVEYGKRISYAGLNIDREYKKIHNNLEKLLGVPKGTYPIKDYLQEYSNWIKANNNAIVEALKSANLQHMEFSNETDVLLEMQSQLNTTQGTLQVIRAASSIASQQIEQMQKLRQLVQSQIQLQAVQVGMAVDEKTAIQAVAAKRLEIDESNKANPDKFKGKGLKFGE